MKKRNVIVILLLVGSSILFLAPKIGLLYENQDVKLTSDSWDHYLVIKTWDDKGSPPENIYGYYWRFPATYMPQLMLHQITGVSLFDSMTIYYLFIGLVGIAVIYGLGREIMKDKTERAIFAGAAAVVYSFIQYVNLLYVQQYPIAIGTLAVLFCIYSFVLLTARRRRGFVCLAIAGPLLAIAHPFAPVFASVFFAVYALMNRSVVFGLNPYHGLISRRTAVFMSLLLIISGMTYSIFIATGQFESGVTWSQLNIKYAWQTITSELFEQTTEGVGKSFESRYAESESIIYPLNWALPTATSMSTILYFLIRRFRVEEDRKTRLLFPLAVMSMFLFLLTFAFSFVEFAFSRYFGAFALAFNMIVTAFVIFRVGMLKTKVLRYAGLTVFAIAIMASVTDPTMMPYISDGKTIFRDDKIYPTQLDLVTWGDFFSTVGDQGKVVRSSAHPAVVRYFQESSGFNNEIVLTAKNYTMLNDNIFLVVEKGSKGDLPQQLQSNPFMDKVYDNSQAYFGN